MKELFDFLDDNLSGQTDPTHDSSQHWLDSNYPYKGYDREEEEAEEEGLGVELLEKPGMNGRGIGRSDRAVNE
jgi:hypothetical protein